MSSRVEAGTGGMQQVTPVSTDGATVRVENECSGPRRIAGRTRRPRETTPGRRGTTFEIFFTKIIFGASAANYLRSALENNLQYVCMTKLQYYTVGY